jgi:predicted  nucleic acid-binding Zn-ribbon protein
MNENARNAIAQVPATVDVPGAEKIEQAVSNMLRGARDEKIRLEAALQNSEAQNDRLLKLNSEISATFAAKVTEGHDKMAAMQDKFRSTLDKLTAERDQWHRRATQLETDMSAMAAVISASGAKSR